MRERPIMDALMWTAFGFAEGALLILAFRAIRSWHEHGSGEPADAQEQPQSSQ